MVIADNNNNTIYKTVCDNLKMDIPQTLTMGIVDSQKKLLAGVIFFVKRDICFISVYAFSPLWALPGNLSEVLRIAFGLLKCKIAKFDVSHKNKRVIRLLKGLGAVQEGLLRYAREDGSHEIVFSFTEKEFKKKRWYR